MEFASPYDLKDDDDISEQELDQWLALADFYNLPYIHYYSSYEDLEKQLAEFQDTQREERFTFLENTVNHILGDWHTVLTSLFPALRQISNTT